MNEQVTKYTLNYYKSFYESFLKDKIDNDLFHQNEIEIEGVGFIVGSPVFHKKGRILEFLFSTTQPIPNIQTGTFLRKESLIRCRAKGRAACFYYKMLTTYWKGECLLYLTGTLSSDLIPTVNLIDLDVCLPTFNYMLEPIYEYFYLCAGIHGKIIQEPKLSLEHTKYPYACYVIEIERDGIKIQIPCKAFGSLCENITSDFQKGTCIIVKGAIQTTLHRDGSLDFYASPDMYQSELYVASHEKYEPKIVFGKDLDF